MDDLLLTIDEALFGKLLWELQNGSWAGQELRCATTMRRGYAITGSMQNARSDTVDGRSPNSKTLSQLKPT